MKLSRFPYSKAAEVLSRCDFETMESIAKEFEVTTRTIQSWKRRLQVDPELQERYREIVDKRAAIVAQKIGGAAEGIPGVLQKAIGFINKALEELDPAEPEALRAVMVAVTGLSELLFILKKYEEFSDEH